MRTLASAALVLAVAGLLATSASPSKTAQQLRCKYGTKVVVKKIHGHKKRVRVCKKAPPAKPKADLAVTVASSLDRITEGNRLTYDITLQNNGPATAHDVKISVSFPAGTQTDLSVVSVGSVGSEAAPLDCEGSSEDGSDAFVWRCSTPELGPVDLGGDAATPSLLMRFSVEPEEAGAFTVTAKAEAGTQTVDPNPGNSDLRSSIDILAGPASADLTLALDATPDPAVVTEDLTMTARVTNHGPTEATEVQATVLLPLGTQLISTDLPDQDCPYSSGVSTITICWPVVRPGETVEQTLTVVPVGSGPPVIEADAVVSAYTPDTNLVDNRTHSSTPVQAFTPTAGVDLVAHVERPIAAEGYVVVPFGVANRGATAPTGAHAVLSLSGVIDQPTLGLAGSIFDPPEIGPCTAPSSDTLDCLIPSLPSGGRVNGYLIGEVLGSGTVKATVTATSQSAETNPGDNTGTASIDVTKRPARR